MRGRNFPEPGSKPRLFFALWPSDSIREELNSTKSVFGLQQAIWTKKENLHITLAFLGSVEAARIPNMFEAISSIDRKTFEITIDSALQPSKSNMLWLTPKQTPYELTRLVADLWKQLRSCGFSSDQKCFSPHVTLARSTCDQLMIQEISPICWPIYSFYLVESLSDRFGSRYTAWESWDL